nr:hypothetical protein CFP56_49456 [Quercus suber]
MTEFLLACLALEVEAVDEAFRFYGVSLKYNRRFHSQLSSSCYIMNIAKYCIGYLGLCLYFYLCIVVNRQ